MATKATRPRIAGNPFVLSRAPSADLLERAGAVRMGKALRRAVSLRDDCSKAKADLLAAERAVTAAQAKDREENAAALSKSRSAAVKATHTEEAERKLADCRRRHEALIVAVESATSAYLKAGEQEAETAAEIAREQRERSAADLRRAHEMVVSALDAYEDLATAANATADPAMKRPRPPLRSAEIGKPAIRNDRGLAWLDALAGWIEEQKLAAEVEEATITFGWSGIGRRSNPALRARSDAPLQPAGRWPATARSRAVRGSDQTQRRTATFAISVTVMCRPAAAAGLRAPPISALAPFLDFFSRRGGNAPRREAARLAPPPPASRPAGKNHQTWITRCQR